MIKRTKIFQRVSSTFFFKSLALFSFGLLFSSEVFASEIKLHDCDGNLRASTEIQEGQTKGLKIILANEESNSKAKLSRNESESVMELRAKDQILIFSSIESGEWKICKDDGKLLAFNTVEFIEGGSESLRTASLVAGGAALLSGIAIASGNSENGDGGSGINLNEPSTEPDRVISEKPAKALESGSTTRPSGEVVVSSRCGTKPATLAATSNDCREDEEAPIISPYD